MKNKKGFTLIELLVVISIIAVLMSIMMPALGRVREQAKKTVCMTNLKQWGVIFNMYTNEYNGKFMPGWGSVGKTAGDNWSGSWLVALKSYYMEDADLLLCPGIKRYETANSTSTSHGSHGAWGVSPTHIKDPELYDLEGSYGINWWITNPKETMLSGFSTKDHWRSANVSGANEIPMLADAAFWIARPTPGDAPPDEPGVYYANGNALGMQRFCVNRHEGRIGMLFMDQSVGQVAIKRLWTYKWHRTFNTEGPWSADNASSRPVWPHWMKNLPEN